MGYYDRPYRYDPTDSGRMFGRSGIGGSVTIWLIGINVVIFLIDAILRTSRVPQIAPFEWGNFNIEQAINGLQVWRFFTYQFLHGGLFHILFNMLILFFFGPMIEQWLGSRRFLGFYLLCGWSGAILFMMLAFTGILGDPQVMRILPLVGASGSIFGVLIACATLFPNRVVHVWAIFPMTLRTLAFIVLGIAVFTLVVGGGNAGGEAAHLGGAALGFVLIKKAHWLDVFDRFPSHKLKPHGWLHRVQQKRTRRRLEKEQQLEREVDAILEKVARHGLQSLTRREKKVLHQATEQRRES